jgi:DNA-binding CsgD family transcriptional regulator
MERLNVHNVLTQAEETIIVLLAAGLTAKEIAYERGVTVSTVRAQIRSIFEKTGIRRQVDLVRLNHRCAKCGATSLESHATNQYSRASLTIAVAAGPALRRAASDVGD